MSDALGLALEKANMWAERALAAERERDQLRAEVDRLRAECEIIAAGARDMAAYKDRSFAQMGDHAGRLEIERDRLRAEIVRLHAARGYTDLAAIRGIVEAVGRGDIAIDDAGVLHFRAVDMSSGWPEPPLIRAVPTDGGNVRPEVEPKP